MGRMAGYDFLLVFSIDMRDCCPVVSRQSQQNCGPQVVEEEDTLTWLLPPFGSCLPSAVLIMAVLSVLNFSVQRNT